MLAESPSPFAAFLELTILDASPDLIRAELVVRDVFTNRNGVMHGGAVMAFADQLGGMGARANLRDGQGTTTLESKTNFFAAVPIGDTLTGECVPLHRGRTTIVLQTKLTRGDGKLAAITTQTQLVLNP
jgi:uncharacterized protein (TIGR00369 family)